MFAPGECRASLSVVSRWLYPSRDEVTGDFSDWAILARHGFHLESSSDETCTFIVVYLGRSPWIWPRMDGDPMRVVVSKKHAKVLKAEWLRGWVNLFI